VDVPHAPLSSSPGSWPSEVEPPQHLAAGYLLPYVVSAEAAYMMRSDRGMVSPSSGRVIRRKQRLLPNLRLHQFHRPSDGTSGELGFVSAELVILLSTTTRCQGSICLVFIKQISDLSDV
jgi:hypothetical protein